MKAPVVLACLVSTAAADTPKWTFDSDKVGGKPAGFTFARTGSGPAGTWQILEVDDAPSGKRVLAQTDPKVTTKGFPLAIAAAPSLADAAVAVKCKPISGKIDQVCGIVVRYQDANTYYVVRANALEDNVRLYVVTRGVRKTIGEASVKVATGKWHDHEIEVKGTHFVVTFDGVKVLDLEDDTLKKPGRIGLWTKADTVMQFDDLSVEAR